MLNEGAGDDPNSDNPDDAGPAKKRSRLDDGYEDWDWDESEIAAPVAEDEVTRYLRDATSKQVETENLLPWWKTEVRRFLPFFFFCNICLAFPLSNISVLTVFFFQGAAYLKLQKLARRYLAVPANSERSFSGAGFIMDDKGTRTAPETLGSIMFLNGYYRTKEQS